MTDLLQKIREKWDENPELKQCHHFLFEKIYRAERPNNLLLIGINPGESASDWVSHPMGKEEESFESDYLIDSSSKSSQRWFNLVDQFVPDNFTVILSQFFFWSSPSVKELNTRLPNWRTGDLIKFCAEQNKRLMDKYAIKSVISPGLMSADIAKNFYNLVPARDYRAEGARVCSIYTGEGRTWIFTKHWTGSRGFSTIQRNKMKDVIQQVLNG